MTINRVFLACLLCTLTLASCQRRAADWPDTSEIRIDPVQTATQGPPVHFAGAKLTPRARFRIDARVLSVKRYRTGPTAAVLPFDVALGWGAMSTTPTIKGLSIRQGERRYYYSWYGDPPPRWREIASSSSNVHVIPATQAVSDQLYRLRPNDRVLLNGTLVDITLPDGGRLRTSLTRTDTWDGACEIMWVTDMRILSPP